MKFPLRFIAEDEWRCRQLIALGGTPISAKRKLRGRRSLAKMMIMLLLRGRRFQLFPFLHERCALANSLAQVGQLGAPYVAVALYFNLLHAR
jgi:hypothetical protein